MQYGIGHIFFIQFCELCFYLCFTDVETALERLNKYSNDMVLSLFPTVIVCAVVRVMAIIYLGGGSKVFKYIKSLCWAKINIRF